MRTTFVRQSLTGTMRTLTRTAAATLACLAALAIPAALHAQEFGTVSGRVTDEGGAPVTARSPATTARTSSVCAPDATSCAPASSATRRRATA